MIESEKVLERKLCRAVKDAGGIAYKFVSPNQRGVPDRICIFPTGVVMFAELKTTGKKPTKLQMISMLHLKSLGMECYVIDRSSQVLEFIDLAKEKMECHVIDRSSQILEFIDLAKEKMKRINQIIMEEENEVQ